MCVAFALTVAKEWEEQRERGQALHVSPAFIYGNRSAGDYEGEGMEPREALENLRASGVCPRDMYPVLGYYETCRQGITQTMRDAAKPYVIKSYARVTTVDELKTALMQSGPVVIGIPIYDSFHQTRGDGLVPAVSGELTGYHMIAVIGWRADGRWIVQNSWGETWGDKGRCYMPMDYLPLSPNEPQERRIEAWTLVDYVVPPEKKVYLGVDYSNPPPAAVLTRMRAANITFVCRYLPNGGRRPDLTPAELSQLRDAGLGVVSIWETNPTYPGFFTAERGAFDGARARTAARSLGQPDTAPIYATVDYDMADAEWGSVEAYLQAFAVAIAPYPMGVYGNYRVIDHAQQRTKYLWQTYAWSAGKLHQAARLYQYKNGDTSFGAEVDLDKAFGDEPGIWTGKITEVETVPTLRLNDKGPTVMILQILLGLAGQQLTPDGQFGSGTLTAVKAFQASSGLDADGIVGPKTWGALSQLRPPAFGALTRQLAAANEKLARINAISGEADA